MEMTLVAGLACLALALATIIHLSRTARKPNRESGQSGSDSGTGYIPDQGSSTGSDHVDSWNYDASGDADGGDGGGGD